MVTARHACMNCFRCDAFSSDTEWKSELINSRNFDKEIGHQNPRYSHVFILFYSVALEITFLCARVQFVFNLIFESLVPWRLRASQWWLLKSELDLSFFLKVSVWTKWRKHAHIIEMKQLLYCMSRCLEFTPCSSSGLVEQINNFQTLSLRDLTAFNSDPLISIDDDYFYHTQNPRRPEVSAVILLPPHTFTPGLWWVMYSTLMPLLSSVFIFFTRSGTCVWDSPSRDWAVRRLASARLRLWVLQINYNIHFAHDDVSVDHWLQAFSTHLILMWWYLASTSVHDKWTQLF